MKNFLFSIAPLVLVVLVSAGCSDGPKDPSQIAVERDEFVAGYVDDGPITDARDFLKQEGNGVSDVQSARAFVDSLYEAGASKVWFVTPRLMAVTLPKGPSQRQSLFEQASAFEGKAPAQDFGQKYMLVSDYGDEVPAAPAR